MKRHSPGGPAGALAMIVSAATVHAEDVNYCKDRNANRQWVERLAEAPDDATIIELFALRTGLCVLIDQGLISIERATAIFEARRSEALIERREQREEQERRLRVPGT